MPSLTDPMRLPRRAPYTAAQGVGHATQHTLALAAVALATALMTCNAAGETTEMQIKRVALFSSGVAYFERQAEVDGNAEVELKFRTDQINDIIKSLVVQDLGGGTVGAVGYASRDPIEKTLKSFGVDLTGNPTLGALLDQLRGEPIEIAGERAVAGVILGVEKAKLALEGDKTIEYDVLNVLTEAGVQQLKVSELRGIKLVNEKIDGELRKALATLAQSHDADRKSVTIGFNGAGKRLVRAAYLLEAPIWKTTYRLVLSPEDKPFLQGWATVENLTEEDWRDVRLSLVSGRPISFVMDLYTPIYIPRPVEELELYASLRAPEYEAQIMGRLAAKSPAPPPAGAARGGRAGLADARERLKPLAYAAEEAPADQAPGIDAGVASVAEARDAGELFEYEISTPVSIPRRHSAMLPIVNQAIEGEKVSIYNPATHEKYPLNGLYVTNSTGLHLMQGPVTIFDDGVYAGDAKLPDLNDKEKRLVAYALDLAVEVVQRHASAPEQEISLKIAKGVMIRKVRRLDDRTYVVRNKAGRDRTVLIEQPYGDDWKLIEPDKPFERTESLSRFRLVVAAGQTQEQSVRLEQVASQQIAISDMDFDAIRVFLASRNISPEMTKALQQVIALRTELTRVQRDKQRAEQEVQEQVQEQARIRENLKTLTQNSDPYARQMKKFDEIETKIETLSARIAELRDAEQKQQQALEQYILSLNLG